jgi:phosphatidate cytidylyltransferase
VNNFTKRTITGIGFVIVLAGSIILEPLVFAGLFLVVAFLGQSEFYRIVSSDEVKPDKVSGLVAGTASYLLVSMVARDLIQAGYLLFSLLMIPLIIIGEMYRKSDRPFVNIGYTLLGILYVVLPLSLLNYFFNVPATGPVRTFGILLGFFVILWLYDTGAYLTGMAFGRHPMFKRISPKKTWEGVVGGTLIGLGIAWTLSLVFKSLSLPAWLGLAVIIILFSTVGDLAESMLKRSLSRKDSGSILPGHGGILDRFDGVLFASPAVFIYLYLVLN